VEVRKILHKTRSIAIENFNEHFKAIFDVHDSVPTKGLLATQRFVLSAVFVYQISTVSCRTWTCGSASKLSSRPLNIYVQASFNCITHKDLTSGAYIWYTGIHS